MALPFFQQGAFAIDPNATPDQIAQKRAYIAAMMPRFGSAKFVGEGVGQLATGVVIGRQNRKLNEAEGAGRKSAADQFARLFGTANSAQSPEVQGPMSVLGMTPQGGQQGDPNSPLALAGDTMAALGKDSGTSGYRESLIGTESGGNWAAQNSETGAGGKKGHFGRVQFGQARLQEAMDAGAIPQGTTPEQFMASPALQIAAENWHFGDLESKLGDLVGAEVNGQPLDMGALVAMGHLGGAGGARKFVESGGAYNPSDSFGTSLAEYAATHGGQGGAAPAPTSAPSIPINELYMALQNPWMSAEEKGLITSMIGEQQQASDPLRQLELRKAEIELAQLENPTQQPPEDFATRMFTLNALQIDPQSDEGKVYLMTGKLPEPPEPGFSTMTAEEVKQLGLPPGSYQRGPKGEIKQIGGGGQTINVNTGSEVGTIPQGFELFTDPTTGARSMRPISGGPEDTTKTDEAKASGTATASDIITTAADRALDANSERVLGGLFGALAAYNPGTPNAEVYRQTDVLKANAKVENLQAMRNESPTGGALGSVTEGETKMLADQAGALDPASPNYERDVKDYTRNLLRVIHGKEAGDAIFDQQFGGLTQSSGVPSGIDPADWEYMTPEERALFQ